MKIAGIVRRTDDLGRIAIPKEIRKQLGIKEGTPIEMYIGAKGELVLNKYKPSVEEIHSTLENMPLDQALTYCHNEMGISYSELKDAVTEYLDAYNYVNDQE